VIPGVNSSACQEVPLAQARRVMAVALQAPVAERGALGAVTLRADQRALVDRATVALARWGGVLLCAPTGAGKTYVALAALAAHEDLLVIAPAALREMWATALQRAGRRARVVSVERLSRGPLPRGTHTAVIVDEAHHLRNSRAQRYAPAQALCAGVPVVLLTATPVHNRADDLLTLLRLFLGADAADLDAAALSSVVLHAEQTTVDGAPPLTRHRPRELPDDAAIVRAIQSLPAPVPPRDGGTALALWRLSLLRAWCSSVHALDAMLRRALLAAAALHDALHAGRRPTRAELRGWSGEDGQLAWPELLASGLAPGAEALAATHTHIEALRTLRQQVAARQDLEAARIAAVGALLDRYREVPVLLCTQYAATVEALWRGLRQRPGVAALTARGGRIASGSLSRQGVLQRFAPLAQGVRPPPSRERITVLVATDVLSEGLNLQDAGVLVHLDAPWTPARLAQREGRVARPGSPHAAVHVHTLRPPTAAAAVLAIDRRLGVKRRVAGRVQRAGSHAARIRTVLSHWVGAAESLPVIPADASRGPLVSLCQHPRAFVVACVADPHPRLLVAGRSLRFSSAPARVAQALRDLDEATAVTDNALTTPATAQARSAPGTAQAYPASVAALSALHRELQHHAAAQIAMTGRRAAAHAHRGTLAAARAGLRVGAAHQRGSAAAAGSATLARLATVPGRHSAADHAPSSPARIIAVVSSIHRTSTSTRAAPP